MKKKERLLRLVPALALLALLIRFPREITDGVRQGLSLCAAAVIPSLFPFMTLCTFVVRSGLHASAGKRCARVMQALFRLPGSAAGAVVLGLCGGYPVGARMAAQLYRAGSATRSQAQRICLFCVAAGPAFVIGTVGASMLGSRALGRILFLALTLSNLTLGVLLRFTDEPSAQTNVTLVPRQPLARSLCESVAAAGEAMLPLCAWILLFSGICAVLRRMPSGAALPLICLAEVTNGCKTGVEAGLSLPLLAAILGFGGLSVHCQVMPDVLACGVPLSRFWAFRALSGALAAVYCIALERMFPMAQTTALLRTDISVHAVSVSAPVSAALLATAAVFILNTSSPEDRRRV